MNDVVVAYGEALLEADTERVGHVDALGLDETLFFRKGPRPRKQWCTSIVDVGGPNRPGKLIDVVGGRTAAKVSDWLDARMAEGGHQYRSPLPEIRLLVLEGSAMFSAQPMATLTAN